MVQCESNTFSILSAGESTFIITEGELFFPAKFMTPKRKTSVWYHEPDESIPVMVKLKQVVMPFIEFIQYKIQQISCHHVLKDTLL